MFDSQTAVARKETGAAMGTMIISPLQFQRAQSALHGLAPPRHIARWLAARAVQMPSAAVGMVGIDMVLNHARGQLQRGAPSGVLQCLKIQIHEALPAD